MHIFSFITLMPLFWVAFLIIFLSSFACIAMIWEMYKTFAVLLAIAIFIFVMAPGGLGAMFMENYITILSFTAIYVSAGILWSFAAFYLHLKNLRRKYEIYREKYLPKYLKENNLTELVTSEHIEGYIKFIETQHYVAIPNQPLFDRSGIAKQISVWPIMLLKFILKDVFKFIADVVMSTFGNVYGKIQQHVFRNFPEFK